MRVASFNLRGPVQVTIGLLAAFSTMVFLRYVRTERRLQAPLSPRACRLLREEALAFFQTIVLNTPNASAYSTPISLPRMLARALTDSRLRMCGLGLSWVL